MTLRPGQRKENGPPFMRVVGALLLLHFFVVVAIKVAIGKPSDILWMSHIGLVTAAVGLLIAKPVLVTAAFIELLALHSIWLFDCISWMTQGHFPMGIATYLTDADGWIWTATAHHFFLLPLLMLIVRTQPQRPLEALLFAMATYLVLTVLSRALLSPAENINYAFGVRIAWDHAFWNWANRNSNGPFYLLGLNAFVGLFMFLPAFGIVCVWRRKQTHTLRINAPRVTA